MLTLIEGYFKGPGAASSIYPKVKPLIKPWIGRKAFLEALSAVENSTLVGCEAYKGTSKCRCCGIRNGSEEYTLVLGKAKWIWPSGFSHYVEAHNVRPSLAFQMLITALAMQSPIEIGDTVENTKSGNWGTVTKIRKDGTVLVRSSKETLKETKVKVFEMDPTELAKVDK